MNYCAHCGRVIKKTPWTDFSTKLVYHSQCYTIYAAEKADDERRRRLMSAYDEIENKQEGQTGVIG